MTTPFTADLGTHQGRIRPTGWTPPNGEYVFCLGHDVPGTTAIFSNNDITFVEQSFDSTGNNILRAAVHLRAPSSMPNGVQWIAVIGTEAFEYFVYELDPGFRERTLVDIAIPTIDNPAFTKPRITLYVLGAADQTELEMPAVYVDEFVTANASQSPFVCSRDPAPADIGVETSPEIRFAALSILGLQMTGAEIFVNGLLVAYMDGLFAINTAFIADGWTIQATNLDNATTYYVLQRSAPFTSEEVITVQVNARDDSNTTSTTWSFTIADTAGPRVVSARAIALYEVEVRFNEAVSASSFDPSYFTLALAPGSILGFVPDVQDVRQCEDQPECVILTLSQPSTPGARYTVTASAGVTDALGNAVEPEYASASFDAYTSELSPANRLLSLYQELPAAERANDEFGELRVFCDVLDEGLRALAAVADEWPLIVADPDTATEQWLDAILWELGNPFAWLPLDIRKKRLLARWMHALVALKGSGIGIRAAIRLLLGIEVQVHVYGWGPAGLGEAVMGESFILGSDDEDDLYTFWVVVDSQLDDETRNYMDRIINIMKVAHERHVIVEPSTPFIPDHWQLGYSQLGIETELHA